MENASEAARTLGRIGGRKSAQARLGSMTDAEISDRMKAIRAAGKKSAGKENV